MGTDVYPVSTYNMYLVYPNFSNVCIPTLCILLVGKNSANEVAADGVETDKEENKDGEDKKPLLLATPS